MKIYALIGLNADGRDGIEFLAGGGEATEIDLQLELVSLVFGIHEI
jgi:hypothetical protein